MGELKGFYFSMDALIAASVLLAMMGFLITYQDRPEQRWSDPQLDQIHTASVQTVSEWNDTKNSSSSVLERIYRQYYEGNKSEAETLCRNYFVTDSEYAIFMADSESREKICGDKVLDGSDLISERTIAPDLKVNQTFIGPKTAVMVMKD